jgi:transposase
MGRSHAWLLKGSVLVEPRPMNWGKNLTMIGAVRRRGWVTLNSMFATANGDRFVAWIKSCLVPKLKRGDVVVMDNAKSHKDARIEPLLAKVGAKLLYLPPYSPDFNPIEPAWALVKKHIKACAPRAPAALRQVARRGRYRVRPSHLEAWYAHCGYRRPRK